MQNSDNIAHAKKKKKNARKKYIYIQNRNTRKKRMDFIFVQYIGHFEVSTDLAQCVSIYYHGLTNNFIFNQVYRSNIYTEIL